MISTRRLRARPASLPLSATGWALPLPLALRRVEDKPPARNATSTAFARRCDNAILAASAPLLSVNPSIRIGPWPLRNRAASLFKTALCRRRQTRATAGKRITCQGVHHAVTTPLHGRQSITVTDIVRRQNAG